MLVRIFCSGQHYGAHIPWRKHHKRLRIGCKIALQIGYPLTLVTQKSSKLLHIPD
jgi:hypothetical protein